jgi:hypothetical protein
VNGEPKALRPATNGYASLKLPAGEVKIELQGNGRTRPDAGYHQAGHLAGESVGI